MEATTTPTPNATPTPQAVATPTPTPTPMATPDVATPQPMTMENGGATPSSSNSGGSFFSSINWLEVSFSILGVAALSYVIYYYRFKLKQDKLIDNELQRQIDELKMNMQTNMKGKYKTI
jgi:hypothetical protein